MIKWKLGYHIMDNFIMKVLYKHQKKLEVGDIKQIKLNKDILENILDKDFLEIIGQII